MKRRKELMEVKFDASKLIAQLQAFEKEATRRMEKMVEGFAYELSLRAIENTPLGDSVRFMEYYSARTDLPQVEGIAQGNWQYSETGNFALQLIAGRQAGDSALDIVQARSSSYKLGKTFYIGNAAPYILALENGYSSQVHSIMQPTLADITGAYAVNLQFYYKRG